MQTHRKKTLDGFFDALPKMAKKFPKTTFILRPHPAESEEAWHKACAKASNIVIVKKGSVIPWLMAARALVHNGCTTGIEYFLLGKSSIAYMPMGERSDESPLPNGVSHHAADEKKLGALIQKSLKGTLKPSRAHSALMNRYLSAQTKALSSERVIDYCDKLLSQHTPARKLSWSYLATYLYCFLRQIHRSTSFGDPAREYIKTVFPKTELEDVKSRALEICTHLDLEHTISVSECAHNIFEIKPSNSE